MTILPYIKRFFLKRIQDKLVFKPHPPTIEEPKYPTEYGLADTVEVTIPSGENKENITIWCRQPAVKGKPTVIFFHGNTGHFGDVGEPKDGDVFDRQYRIKVLRKIIERGYGFIAPSLRGYGNSEGEPSEKNFLEDLSAISDFIKNEEYGEVIVMGESLGAFKALYLAKLFHERDILMKLIALISPFASVEEKVYEMHPDLKKIGVEKQLNHHFNNKKILEETDFQVPILIQHPEEDEVTNPYHSEMLLETGKSKGLNITLKYLKDSGHITWRSDEVFDNISYYLD